jgi:hypothetical protein
MIWLRFRFVVFNVTFNNISVISWRSVWLMEETGVLGENHWPVASHWQTLSHSIVSSTPRHERVFELTILVVIGTDCTGSCKFNYHTITTMTAPENYLFMISSMNVALISDVYESLDGSFVRRSSRIIRDLIFYNRYSIY